MGAFVVLYPRARIQSLVFLGFFYQLIAVPAILVLGFWFALQLWLGLGSFHAHKSKIGGAAAYVDDENKAHVAQNGGEILAMP